MVADEGEEESMYARRTLLIVLSITLFLALVLGIGLLAFYPDTAPGVARAGVPGEPEPVDPVEYRSDRDEPDDPEAEPDVEDPEPEEVTDPDEDEFIIVYSTGEERVIDPDDRQRFVRELSVDKPEHVPAPPDDPEPPEEPEPTPDPEPEPVPRPDPEPDPEPRPEPRPDPAPEPEPETRPAPSREYWVQLAATGSRDAAETARDTLRGHTLRSVVFPTRIDGDIYYRVRVGPYREQREAEKFLAWIEELDDFEDGYVSLVYRDRS